MTIVNDERDFERLEQLLRQAADDLRDAYPPTPPIAALVRRQLEGRRAPVLRWRMRLVRAAAIAAAAFAALLLLSPDARQAVARFFGLETVRIERVATLPAPTRTPPSATPSNQQTIQPAPELAGRTTLHEARAKADFDVRLPAYPPGLGQPMRVYFQDFGFGQQVILVYPNFVLFQAEGVIYGKGVGDGTVVEEVEVGGLRALWLSGSPHLILIQAPNGSYREESSRIVEGNVLAWETPAVTYRLETNLPLAEALRIAESLYTTRQPAGLTTLTEAQAKGRFEVRLPTEPADLGEPERVYFQDLGFAQQVILVYPDFSLYEAEGAIYQKSVTEATVVEEVRVNDRPALWLSGAAHLVQMRSPSGAIDMDFVRVVEGNVLAWEAGDITYRIETTLPLEEAVRIAESIHAVP